MTSFKPLKHKAYSHSKLNVTKVKEVIINGVENMMGKGENAGHQHFLTMFSNLLLSLHQMTSFKPLKHKAYSHSKLNVTTVKEVIINSVENMVGKGENAGHQHFLTMFLSLLLTHSHTTPFDTPGKQAF